MLVDYDLSDEEPQIQPKVSQKQPEPKKTVQIPAKKKTRLPDVDKLLGSIPKHSNEQPEEEPDTLGDSDYHNVPPPQFSLKADAELKEAVYERNKRFLPKAYADSEECPVMDKYLKLNEKDAEKKMEEQKSEPPKAKSQHKGNPLAPTQLKTKRANIAIE